MVGPIAISSNYMRIWSNRFPSPCSTCPRLWMGAEVHYVCKMQKKENRKKQHSLANANYWNIHDHSLDHKFIGPGKNIKPAPSRLVGWMPFFTVESVFAFHRHGQHCMRYRNASECALIGKRLGMGRRQGRDFSLHYLAHPFVWLFESRGFFPQTNAFFPGWCIFNALLCWFVYRCGTHTHSE